MHNKDPYNPKKELETYQPDSSYNIFNQEPQRYDR